MNVVANKYSSKKSLSVKKGTFVWSKWSQYQGEKYPKSTVTINLSGLSSQMDYNYHYR